MHLFASFYCGAKLLFSAVLSAADFPVTLKKPNQQLYRKEQGASTNEVAKVMVIA